MSSGNSCERFSQCRLSIRLFLIISGLWAVVNNAGIGRPGMIEWETVEQMKRTVDINLWGMVSVTKAFLPLLKRTKGRVVNVASTWGRVAVPGVSAYSISKFGVQAFSDSMRNEVRHFGVTVHIIEPGMFNTKIMDSTKNVQYLEKLWGNLDAETKECYGVEFFEESKKHLILLYNIKQIRQEF